MELISHIHANATFSRDFLNQQSRLKIASIKRIFRIVKERHGLIGRATQTFCLCAFNAAGNDQELVEPTGIEPVTSCLQSRRSPS